MSTNESRPGGRSQATSEAFHGANTTTLAAPDDNRPRCVRCGHVLRHARSLARGYGRVCWLRTCTGRLDAERDAVGRHLARVARRVARLDSARVAAVEDLLTELDAALDAEGMFLVRGWEA